MDGTPSKSMFHTRVPYNMIAALFVGVSTIHRPIHICRYVRTYVSM